MKTKRFLILMMVMALAVLMAGQTDKPAQFPGGQDSLQAFLKRTVIYPQEAKDIQLKGEVKVKLMIDKKGVITEAVVTKGIGYGTEDETLRVIYAMPKWEPEIIGGKPIASQKMMAIQFPFE